MSPSEETPRHANAEKLRDFPAIGRLTRGDGVGSTEGGPPSAERRAMLFRAIDLFLEDDARAHDELASLLDAPPEDAGPLELSEIWRMYSAAQSAKGDIGGALESLEKSLELAPGCVDALRRRAFIQMDIGRRTEAMSGYRDVLAINPLDAVVVHNLTAMLIEQGDSVGAMATCEAFLAAGGFSPNVAVNAAFLSVQLGWTNEIIDLVEASVISHPEDHQVMHAGYLAAIEVGNYPAALARALELRRRKPDQQFQWCRINLPIHV